MDDGFANENIAYLQSLTRCEVGDQLKAMLEKNKDFLTADTTQKLRSYLDAFSSPDVVLTNFPSMRYINAYCLQQRISWIKLKASIPRVDYQNQFVPYLGNLLDWLLEPRVLRSLEGFDRHEQNSTRHFDTSEQKMPAPGSKRGGFS